MRHAIIFSSLLLLLGFPACGGDNGVDDAAETADEGTDDAAGDADGADHDATGDDAVSDDAAADDPVREDIETDLPVSGDFAFLAYGDSRAGGDCTGNEIHMALVQRMAAEPDIAFTAHMGDMVTGYDDTTCYVDNGQCTDPGGIGNFSAIIEPLSSRIPPAGLPASFIPVIGNHDDNNEWYPDPCGGHICDVFDMTALINHPTPNNDPCGEDYPEYAYYSFTYLQTAFFVLHVNYDYFDFFECNYPPDGWDTCEDYCRNGPRDATLYETCWNVHQYDWLKDGLAQASSNPAVRHIVVYLHAPVYTSFEDHPPVTAAPALAELFDAHGVGLVMNGHNHCYERTVPIRAGAEDPAGTVYVTTSGGGVETGDAAGDWFTTAHSADHHYVRLDVSDDAIRGTVINVDGATIDTFTVD